MMASINPYLIFNGNCEEAFLFYQSVFGGAFPYVGKLAGSLRADRRITKEIIEICHTQ